MQPGLLNGGQMMLVVRDYASQAVLVRFRDRAIEAHRDDAAEWLLHTVVPNLLALSAEDSRHGGEIRAAAEVLLSDRRLALLHRDELQAPAYVLRRLAGARAALLADAEEASAQLAKRRESTRFLVLHGSVAGMLEARFATLVDVVAALRDLPFTGALVTEAYRAAVAAICRSMLLAQVCMNRRVVPERLEALYRDAADLLKVRSDFACTGAGE